MNMEKTESEYGGQHKYVVLMTHDSYVASCSCHEHLNQTIFQIQKFFKFSNAEAYVKKWTKKYPCLVMWIVEA